MQTVTLDDPAVLAPAGTDGRRARRRVGPGAPPADARARHDHHAGGLRGAGHLDGDAGGGRRPRRPRPLRLGVQRLLPRQPPRHRHRRPGRRPARHRVPVPRRAGAVHRGPVPRRAGAVDGRARRGPGPPGDGRRRHPRRRLRHRRPLLPGRHPTHGCSRCSPPRGWCPASSARRRAAPSRAPSAGGRCSSPCCPFVVLAGVITIPALTGAPEPVDGDDAEPGARSPPARRSS